MPKDELPKPGRFYGIPELRQQVIVDFTQSLLFNLSHGEPGAFIIVGPQKVGKTSAIHEVERTLVSKGYTEGKDFAHVISGQGTPNMKTLFFREIPIQDQSTLHLANTLVLQGCRVVLDVVNKEYPLGDARNTTEAVKVIGSLFEPQTLYVYPLFAVQENLAIPAIAPKKRGGVMNLDANPYLQHLKSEHLRTVKEIVKDGIFVAGDTYVNEFDELVTELIWTGKHTDGSPIGQNVTTSLRKR